MDKKIKVWAYMDSPTSATGFSTVSRNIFEALHRTGRYEISNFGINYWGDPHEFPYKIFPAGTNGERDPYGRRKFCQMTPRMDFDILFLLQDTFIMDFLPELMPHLKQNMKKPFRSIVYFPVDSILKPEWAVNISYADEIFAYTEHGKAEAIKALPSLEDIKVIPHGVNLNDYNVIPKEKLMPFKKQYFGKHADKFIVMNLNRNQQRKDIPRTIQAFVEFRKQVKDSILYLHMAQKDQGWNLLEVCRSFGLSTSEDVIFPENFSVNSGYPKNIVNALYNCADVSVSTNLGEGFGLQWVESMATKTPVIMPNNTAMTEFITEDKGYLVKSGTNPSLWTVLPNDNEVRRPLVDVEDMVDKMLHVYYNREEAAKKAETAYNWVRSELDWQGKIGQAWVNAFDNAYLNLTNPKKNVTIENTNKVIEAETF